MFPYASLCLLILFLGLVTSLPSWFRPSLAAVLFGVWSTLKHRIFHPVDARFFPRKCNLAKLMRWKKKKHVFHAASVFFENVLGAAGDVMFLFLQCSVLLRHHFHHIHHSCITNGFLKSLAGGITFQFFLAETYENQWLSTRHCWVFGQLCIAFWSGEISLPRWLWIYET